ncbi:MAG: hypothetical protein IM526_02890 [Microcystis sp. M38BS1]|uniref:LamG-like jellyroll fold domain-containing protein n=1 Tax=Microcystis sp. M38BS1 TaxID=2771188 RepID=UPI0031FC96DC|nr:hypothetical protein [Microcystis sp. M38BS1]MCA6582609.1 hypothetical protein [Pseudanabaena sp. M34BS1SP1A06MG]
MKLSAAFNHSFSAGYSYTSQVYDAAKLIPDLNGLYLCDPDYLEFSKIGVNNSNQVQTVYNLLFDGNFLYASGGNPTLIASDSQFNNQPSIDFANSGTQKLLFNTSVQVGTLIIVYLTRVSGSYLVYAPRQIGNNPPVLYDAFPSGGSSLWAQEPLANNSVYDATSRINSRSVSPTTFIPLNNPRILSVTNISNSNEYESVSGFGGSYRDGGKSVCGKIAAIITSSSPCPLDTLATVEAKLAQIYVAYNGTVISSQPSFRVFVGAYFSFDFATISVDEFFDITSYTYISPSGLGLSFTGSVLSGYVPEVFDGSFDISITNSNSMVSYFSFSLETVIADPFILNFPQQSNIAVSLSTLKDVDDIPYGIYTDAFGNITKWEDSRRLPDKPLYVTSTADSVNQITYDGTTSSFITNSFLNARSLSGSVANCKTFIWVYKQKQIGERFMANAFPDIFANGVLWTTPTSEEVFGTTAITQLNTKVNKVGVNAFNYQLPIEYGVIITATNASTAIPFSGFTSQLKGELLYFIGWSVALSNAELTAATHLLANKFFASTLLLFSTTIEYRYTSSVIVNLNKKVTEIAGNAVSYEILVNHYSATISGNDLIFTCPTDDFVSFTIRAYTTTESLTFSFSVSITLLTNQLYINLKGLLNTFSSFFIVTPETATLSSGNILQLDEYRTNGQELLGVNAVNYTTPTQTDGLPVARFNIDGSSHLDYGTPSSSSGYCFVMAYIRKEGQTGAAFLFGQNSNNIFNSGNNGELLATDFYGDVWANGAERERDYVLPEEALSVVIFNSTDLVTINSIAKDRVFEDRSVKGSVAMFCIVDYKISPASFSAIERSIRDYYQPAKIVTLLNFDSGIIDQSYRTKTLTSNISVLDTVTKKFGAASFPIANNSAPAYVQIPNDSDYSFLSSDFTIAGWLLVDRATTGSEVVNIYTQQGLSLFFSADRLYLGRSLVLGLALFSVALQLSSTVFNHVALTRQNGVLRLYVGGVRVYEAADDYEYRDWNTDAQIGQATAIITSGLNINLDSFVVYRRISLYNGASFAPPSSAYAV